MTIYYYYKRADHVKAPREVMQAMGLVRLTLNSEKCLCKKNLGMIYSNDNITPLSNKEDLVSFLCMMQSILTDFIENFAQKIAPLHRAPKICSACPKMWTRN